MESTQLLSYRSPNPFERFADSPQLYNSQAISFISSPEDRKTFRSRRNLHYHTFRNETLPIDFDSARLRRAFEPFAFAACYAKAPCKVEHFQLKHCLQVSPSNEIYVTGPGMGEISVFDTLTREAKLAFQLKGLDSMRITTFGVRDRLIATGGMNGQLCMDSLYGEELHIREQLSPPELQNITNSVKFVDMQGNVELMVGSNNKSVLFFDPTRLDAPKRKYQGDVNINSVSLSSDSALVAAVGDEINCHVLSSSTMEHVFSLSGHKDHNFSVAWHPTKPYLLATGGQDRSVRVWDTRVVGGDTCRPLITLFGELAAVLNVHFSNDGELLIWGESIDYVHITESRLFEEEQIVDFFGEISGIGMSQESASPSSLYIGVSDSHYPSILELRRKPPPLAEFLLV